MGFLEHLDELRTRIIRAGIARRRRHAGGVRLLRAARRLRAAADPRVAAGRQRARVHQAGRRVLVLPERLADRRPAAVGAVRDVPGLALHRARAVREREEDGDPVRRADVSRQPGRRALQPLRAVSGADDVLRRVQLGADEVHARRRGHRRPVSEDDARDGRRLSDSDGGVLPREDAAGHRPVSLAQLPVRHPADLHRRRGADAVHRSRGTRSSSPRR